MNSTSRAPVVVVEPLGVARTSSVRSGLRVWDRSCDADGQMDSGCALGSLPVFELPRCDGLDRAAMPVLDLPPDVMPYDCSVEVRSMGDVPFTFDPGWRSHCIELDDGSHECSGVFAVASLTPEQEIAPPQGVQAVLTLSCHGYEDEARPLVMSTQAPAAAFFARPVCGGSSGAAVAQGSE